MSPTLCGISVPFWGPRRQNQGQENRKWKPLEGIVTIHREKEARPSVENPTGFAQSPLSKLPIELWLKICHHISDLNTLARLMRVNHLFYSEIEPILYNTVTLDSEGAVLSFIKSVLRCPRHALHLRCLHILTIEGIDTRVIEGLPHLFRAARNIRCLSYTPLTTRVPETAIVYARPLIEARFPSLHSLTTNIHEPLLLEFFQAHPLLTELHFTYTYTMEPKSWHERISRAHLPALRTLSCPPRLLRADFPRPPLTHLHLAYHDLTCLFQGVKMDLCTQLISLRLGAGHIHRPASMRQYTLDDVTARLPALRFLEMDMPHEEKPYLSQHLIAWHAPSKLSRSQGRTTPRFTVAWIFARPKHGNVELATAAAWHAHLNSAALDVLQKWGHCIERIVYRHTIIPCVSVSLSGDGMRLVRQQDWEMSDEYWKDVPA